VAVKPGHQRRGAGTLLTQWGLSLAEQLQLPVYLESSPQANRLYQNLGFLQVDKVTHKASVLGKDKDVEISLFARMPSTLELGFEEWRSKQIS
jgi:N-acetylglutamate synthase-like GNAT family acetyltransferase